MDGAMVEEVKDQIIDLIGCKPEDILLASARTGMGVERILKDIVERIPAPEGDPDAPLQALIFDSVFNSFRGIIVYYRILNGSIKKGDKVKFVSTGHSKIGDGAKTGSKNRGCGLYHYRYQKCKRSKSRGYHYRCK
jgi:GTP-binding protein LepA